MRHRFRHGAAFVINAATYWRALPTNGIPDKIQGLGRLLEEF